MSSLIAVSPRKTGVALTGAFDPAKLIVRNCAVSLGTIKWLKWVGDRFVFLCSGGPGYVYTHWVFDATQDLTINGRSNNGDIGIGLDWTGVDDGNDSATLVATTNTSGTNVSAPWVSYDLGMDWTRRSVGTGSAALMRNPCKGWTQDGAQVWLATNSSAATMRRSNDNGDTWISERTPFGGGAIAFSPTLGKWVRQNVSTRGFHWSVNLVDWFQGQGTASTIIAVEGKLKTFSPFYWLHDRFIGILNSRTSFVYSMDGENWIEVSFPDVVSPNDTGAKVISRIIYGNGLWIIIASQSNAYAYSIDGIDWKLAAFPEGFLCQYAEYGNGQFLFTRNTASNTAATSYLTYDFS